MAQAIEHFCNFDFIFFFPPDLEVPAKRVQERVFKLEMKSWKGKLWSSYLCFEGPLIVNDSPEAALLSSLVSFFVL